MPCLQVYLCILKIHFWIVFGYGLYYFNQFKIRIGISFFETRIGSESKKTLSDHLRCGDAVVNTLAMFPLSNNTSRYSATNYIASAKRGGILFYAVGRGLRFRKWCTVHGVRAIQCNWGLLYVEQFLFCRPLVKHTTREKMFKKVNFVTKEHQFSWTDCVSFCADGRVTRSLEMFSRTFFSSTVSDVQRSGDARDINESFYFFELMPTLWHSKFGNATKSIVCPQLLASTSCRTHENLRHKR